MRTAAALVALAAAVPGLAVADPFAGAVHDLATGAPIAGALIVAGDEVIVADARGRFTLPAPAAAMTVIVQAAGYRDAAVELTHGQRGLQVALVSARGEYRPPG